MMANCTTLDHVYPRTVPGTPCYCGAKTWAGAPRAAAVFRPGARVRIVATDDERIVLEKMRGEDVYRVDQASHGRTLFEREELVSA